MLRNEAPQLLRRTILFDDLFRNVPVSFMNSVCMELPVGTICTVEVDEKQYDISREGILQLYTIIHDTRPMYTHPLALLFFAFLRFD